MHACAMNQATGGTPIAPNPEKLQLSASCINERCGVLQPGKCYVKGSESAPFPHPQSTAGSLNPVRQNRFLGAPPCRFFSQPVVRDSPKPSPLHSERGHKQTFRLLSKTQFFDLFSFPVWKPLGSSYHFWAHFSPPGAGERLCDGFRARDVIQTPQGCRCLRKQGNATFSRSSSSSSNHGCKLGNSVCRYPATQLQSGLGLGRGGESPTAVKTARSSLFLSPAWCIIPNSFFRSNTGHWD